MTLALSDAPTGPVSEQESVILAALARHRMATTNQLARLAMPGRSVKWVRRRLAWMAERGLVERLGNPGEWTQSRWFLSPRGADLADSPYRLTADKAGVIAAHTLSVNEVGIAFMDSAAAVGDECGPEDWTHEVAHPLVASPGRDFARKWVCADATLHYTRHGEDGEALLTRFVEVDRGGMSLSARFVPKLLAYSRLRNADTEGHPQDWRRHYLAFPRLLVVFAPSDHLPTEDRARRRAETASRLLEAAKVDLEVSFTWLGSIQEHGVWAPVFTVPGVVGRVDLLGRAA